MFFLKDNKNVDLEASRLFRKKFRCQYGFQSFIRFYEPLWLFIQSRLYAAHQQPAPPLWGRILGKPICFLIITTFEWPFIHTNGFDTLPLDFWNNCGGGGLWNNCTNFKRDNVLLLMKLLVTPSGMWSSLYPSHSPSPQTLLIGKITKRYMTIYRPFLRYCVKIKPYYYKTGSVRLSCAISSKMAVLIEMKFCECMQIP